MARPRTELHSILKGLDGVAEVYFQGPTDLVYPCIVYQRSDSLASYADNIKHVFKKRYDITVIDRNPDSLIPDQVEGLPYSKFDRFFVVDGLNHFTFQLFF